MERPVQVFLPLEELLSLKLMLVILLVSTFALGCGSGRMNGTKAPTDEGGTAQDGGGGSIPLSTPEQVEKAILDAQKVFLEPGTTDEMSPFQKAGLHAFNDKKLRPLFEKIDPFPGTALSDNFKRSKIIINKEKPCKSSLKSHNDASVTSNKFGADICMSLPRLLRVAPSSLPQEVTSLLAHEIVHLHGYGEEEAREVHLFFAENYTKIFVGDGLNYKMKVYNFSTSNEAAVFNAYEALHFGSDVATARRTSHDKLDKIAGRLDAIFLLAGPNLFVDPVLKPVKPQLSNDLMGRGRDIENRIAALHLFIDKSTPGANNNKVTFEDVYHRIQEYTDVLEQLLFGENKFERTDFFKISK